MAKAGIFDPWRQTPEVPETNSEPRTALRVEDALEPEARAQTSCVAFPGHRGRLNVWFPQEGAEAQDGIDTVVNLVHSLYDKDLVLARVDTMAQPDWVTLRSSDGRKVYIDTEDSAEAADILVFALRALRDNPLAEPVIRRSGVHALIV